MTSPTRDPFFSTERELDEEERRAIARASLVFNLTEELLVRMERAGVTRADLARRLGCTHSAVTRALGGRSLELSMLGDLCHALEWVPRISLERAQKASIDESPAGQEDRGVESVGPVVRVDSMNNGNT